MIDALRDRFGVRGHEIRLETHGSDLPAVDDGREYQPQNRRVEIRVRPVIDADEPQQAGAPGGRRGGADVEEARVDLDRRQALPLFPKRQEDHARRAG